MGMNPEHLTRMSEQETAAVRALMDRHGWRGASRMLGVFAERTLWKVCAGATVSKLTAQTIREHLAALDSEAA